MLLNYYLISLALTIIILLLDIKHIIRNRPDKVEAILLTIAIALGFIIPLHYSYSYLEDLIFNLKQKFRKFKLKRMLNKIITENFIIYANRHPTDEERAAIIKDLWPIAGFYKMSPLLFILDERIFMLTKVMVALKILESNSRSLYGR